MLKIMKKSYQWNTRLLLVTCLAVCMCVTPAAAGVAKDSSPKNSAGDQSNVKHSQMGDHQNDFTLLPGHRIIHGVVEVIEGDHAKVNSGDTGEINPRYLSLERAKEKGFTLKQDDKVTIVVNDKNHVVDYHLANGERQSHHKVIKGRLAQPLKVGQEQAIIKTQDGKEKSFPVRPLARSEVAAIPFDTEGLFLIDETNKIASATLTKNVVSEDDWGRSTAMNVYRHIEGVVKKEPKNQSLTLQTTNKESVTLPVWDYLKEEMTDLSKGMQVTVLVDSEDKIVDIAHLPKDQK